MKIKNQNRKNQNNPISLDSAYDSVTYDPVKTTMLESEAEAEETNNHKTRNRVLQLVYSSASGCSDNQALTESQATESYAEWVFCFRLHQFNFTTSYHSKASDYDSNYNSVASENQPLAFSTPRF